MAVRDPRIKKATQYAEHIVAGKIPASEAHKKCCERHLKDLSNGSRRGLKFDENRATHILDFFQFLRHSKGEWVGQVFQLEDWQTFLLSTAFGWTKKDGARRFRNAYTEIPRKNGKSALASGVGLYLFMADGEAGSEVYSAATKKEQAQIVFQEAVRMVRKSPDLSRRIQVFRNNLSIARTASKFEPLGADEDTLDGLNVHAAIIDELHAHKTRGVYDVLDTATGARREPMIFSITTAGVQGESICKELRDYTLQVANGVIEDDTWFGFIACADPADDWTQELTWRKANPNYGVSVKPDDLERKCERAKSIPSYQNTFKRLHLNLWTEQEEHWIPLEVWDLCVGNVDAYELQKKKCYVGMDLSHSNDVSSIVLGFPHDNGFKILPFFYMPEEDIRNKSLSDRAPYDQWAARGLITLTEGNVVDYRYIRHDLNKLAAEYDIQMVCYDPWNASHLVQDLREDGLNCEEFRQGYTSMNAPTKEFERLVTSRRLEHGGNPVLRWMLNNTTVRKDPAGNIKPDKQRSRGRIDGVVASIMSLGGWLNEPREEAFIYNSMGIYWK